MSKHTAAPWTLISTDCRREQMNNHFFSATAAVLIGNLGHKITMDGGTFKIDEFIANARLIAAAPELLNALKEIVDGCLNRNPEDMDARQNLTKAQIEAIARAAIAKAEGK